MSICLYVYIVYHGVQSLMVFMCMLLGARPLLSYPPMPLPEDLPEVELSLQRGPLSPGEAPGRAPLTPHSEDQRKRKNRSFSSSPGTSQSLPNRRPEMTLQEEIVAAELVLDCTVKTPPPGHGLLLPPEVGYVTNVQGQCTPSRLKQTSEAEISSPIFRSKRQLAKQH